ncbi:hypothetical protein [Methanococcoides methylutens]|uniref:Uncharacterized protein n=1 Tax=Methanococcoides methylutens MM1 TaxID=1434104 RepID=A0A0E3X0Q3_METMT|nr:hypothetical protein [Methanococcoides methylutens]AKB85710.1 hypothetical protein MCMEM_1657 [Methanococcoides methylutens MM1]
MVQPEEIEGMVDALGAVTYKEIVEFVQELAYTREEDVPEEEEISKLLEKAVSEHLLETITSRELSESDSEAGYEVEKEEEGKEEQELINYYIVGPNAFPDFPFDLSEVIDILKLDRREVDPDKLTRKFSRRLKAKITKLEHNIEAFAKGEDNAIDIPTLEHRYSDLLNLYYDYDSWIEGGFPEMEEEVLAISKHIDALGAAQDI